MFLIETFARLPAQASSCNSSHSPQQCGIGEAARAALEVREARRTARLAERAEREASEVSTASERTALANGLTLPQKRATTAAPNLPRPNPAAAAFRQNYRDEAKVRIEAALNAEIGFAERLTWFWSNHFCISAAKNGVRPLAGAYEREAIRPNVLGRFADMLLAAETHPAMLIYLDNARSIGPNSQAGRDRGKGLNENLAREILELHTLGVRTVYTQDDVTRFAKIITGWTVIPPREEHGGEFRFNPHMHEPARRHSSAGRSQTVISTRAARCSSCWRAIRQPPGTSPPSWCGTLSAISQSRRSPTSSPSVSWPRTAISRRWPRRWSPRRNPGA